MNTAQLPDSTHITYVHLRVSDLRRSFLLYKEILGFQEMTREGETVSLSPRTSGHHLLVLTEKTNAKPRPHRSTGLFHVAIRLPNRKELARTFKQLHEHQWPLQGFSDHGVSEAIYLSDPDNIGIELYADRPKDEWPRNNGELAMFTAALDLESLLGELAGDKEEWKGIHPHTDIGHVHLNVSDLGTAEQFYHNRLGFDVITRRYPGALFVSAGGYHHHIGMNTWTGTGAPAPPPDTVGLVRYGIAVPDETAKTRLKQKLRAAGIHVEETREKVFIHDQDGMSIEIS